MEHIIAAKAVAFGEALAPGFKEYQMRIVKNAAALADGMREQGFRLVSGGTDNHMMLVDLGVKGVTGKDAEKGLDEVNITVNKNAIPFDPQPPMTASGIRLGTPAMTTRGMGESEMREIARLIGRAVDGLKEHKGLEEIKEEVLALCAKFPLYPELNT